jgi:hypothetical protein
MDPSPELVFPVLTSPPPAPVVDMEAFFHLVEETRDLIRDRDALERDILAEDMPVRFRL